MAERAPFIVMVKPVGSRCNMRCSYCYYLDRYRFSTHKVQSRLEPALLDSLIRQTILGQDSDVISFVWHGGEPSLAGLDFYREAVRLEKKYLPEGKRVFNNLQTNGLELDDAWCRFLAENHFDVGISLDGTQASHDSNRKDLQGNPTWMKIRSTVERLKRCGILPDLLCTVNSGTVKDPEAVYRSLKELKTGWIQFIPVVNRRGEEVSGSSVTAQEYGDFLCAVFKHWATRDLGTTDVQLFAETASVLTGHKPALCWMQETCGRAVVAEEDGSIYACDHFVSDEFRRGNLRDEPLEKMVNSPEQEAFGRAKKEGLCRECRECPWAGFCGGGCPKDRFLQTEDGKTKYYLCEGLKKYFELAVPALRELEEMSRNNATLAEMKRAMRRKLL